MPTPISHLMIMKSSLRVNLVPQIHFRKAWLFSTCMNWPLWMDTVRAVRQYMNRAIKSSRSMPLLTSNFFNEVDFETTCEAHDFLDLILVMWRRALTIS